MDDLISRSGLWTDIMMLPHNGDIISSEEVEQAIVEAPAVDAVEVVRCKDCKRCDGFPQKEIEEDEVGICKVTRMVVFPHFFCNYGDRRADDAID